MPGKTTKSARSKAVASSGNVFADMGLDNPSERAIKAELARQINARLDELHLTQVRAAHLLGLHQSEISLLRRGRLGAFAIERLIRCLGALDMGVQLHVFPRKPVPAAGVPLGRAAKRRKALRPRVSEPAAKELVFA